jgi:hypothetical protein
MEPVPRQKLTRNVDHRREAKEWYLTSTEEMKYDHVSKNIEYQYNVICRHHGKIIDGHIIEHPDWLVTEKNPQCYVYDTTFVIIYCAGGEYVKLSLDNYEKIKAFCLNVNDYLLLTIETNGDQKTMKGKCGVSSNITAANKMLSTIFNKEKRWYQCFYF